MANPDLLQEIEALIKKNEPVITEKSIVITPDERRRLEKLLGKNLTTGDDLIRMVEKAVTLNVSEIQVELTPFLMDRLQSRAIRTPLDQFIKITVKRLLEEYAGLR